jgi:DNA-binding Lrp family transcriptional regulator
LRNVELELIAELMKNSRRSDRELARILKVSQPTVSRLISRLEKEGVIKEYTMIPNFCKLGFNIMSLIMLKLKPISTEELNEQHRAASELDNQEHRPFIMIMRGMGLGKNLAILAFHKDYGDYATYIHDMKNAANSTMKAYIDLQEIESFLVDLNDKNHYQSITFSNIAANFQTNERTRSSAQSV